MTDHSCDVHTIVLPAAPGAVRCHCGQQALLGVELHSEQLPACLPAELPPYARQLPDQLRRYLSGEPLTLQAPLQWPAASAFRQAVWQACRQIPWGQRCSYGQLAAAAGSPRAARAVGACMAANRFPLIIPCHRVVAADGALTGFGAGLPWKRFLLQLESGMD